MTCPQCGRKNPPEAMLCMTCGNRLRDTENRTPKRKKQGADGIRVLGRAARFIVLLIIWGISLAVVGYGVYKGYYWWASDRMVRAYEDGTLRMPELEEISFDDGRTGHVLTFFGEDGDTIFIEELRQSFMVINGEARIVVPDGDWFDTNPEGVEGAEILLTPVKTDKHGVRTLLPSVSFTVSTPSAPLTIVKPAVEREVVLTSMYQLEMVVTPGSTVLVDGADVSDMVGAMGDLSVNVAVYPTGDNVISVLVQTPNHLETRQDIVLYREEMDIELDLDLSVGTTTSNPNMTVRGTVEPGASIVVDSAHVPGSVQVTPEGSYSFQTQFDSIGYNIIRIRATMEGREDATITFRVYYLPTITDYSSKAWKMDYDQLTKTYATWQGRVFLCEGEVVEVLSLEPQVLVLDVGSQNEYQPLVIENLSEVSVTQPGGKYRFYADVDGVQDVAGKRLVKLIARYGSVQE